MKHKYGVLLLAAGASSRMGQPKALLSVDGKTLLSHRLSVLSSECYDIYVVTGGFRDSIQPILRDHICTEVYNPEWQDGIGRSISRGVLKMELEGYEYVIIVAMDQVKVDRLHIESMIAISCRHPQAIICAQYGNTRGIPTLFPLSVFEDLKSLKGDTGARKIIKNKSGLCIYYHIPEAHLDLDTMKDYLDFIQGESHENN